MIAPSPFNAFRNFSHLKRASALIIVLAMVAIMTGLVITVFVVISGERRSSAARLQGVNSEQLASSAPQIVISQIRDAVTAGNNAWASQPGMVRTYGPTGSPVGVYKLYSASRMFAAGTSFQENEDTPRADWNVGHNSALFCDINQPVTVSSGGLVYPVAYPGPAATSFTTTGAIPGYKRAATATPGFDPGSAASSSNNPLPMPVRWLYILKNGEFAVPGSITPDGKITFLTNVTQPTKSNPVIGRLAFWTDDDTSKININTAGYAKNDASYWTYWDTPVANTQDENTWLSWAQPWTNEYQRYPGHPATTGLNVVFDSLNLDDAQILALTPSFVGGGTSGGRNRVKSPPTTTQVDGLHKDERLFPTIDEMFYNPQRGANAAGIPRENLEERRFLLTASSRAPETTLFNTPRVTLWPTWQTERKRTPLDRLIAFCSTMAGQPFYFVRESPLSTQELMGISQNLSVWTYLQTLSNQSIPGFGGDFGTKYGTQVRDQILTSMFDAIRLANLDDRTPPAAGSSTGWSYTAGELTPSSGTWAPSSSNKFTEGYIAPTMGPNNTRGAGRNSALAEVAILFARTSDSTAMDGNNVREVDKVKVAVMYGFFAPAAGFVQPGQNRRIRVSGLTNFRVRPSGGTEQQVFADDVFDHIEFDSVSCRRELGGRMEWSASQMFNPPGTTSAIGPPTGNVVLPYNSANVNSTFLLSGPGGSTGVTLKIEVYSPSTESTAYQTYEITFPPASALTPMAVSDASAIRAWTSNGRWMRGTAPYLDLSEGRISFAGDTVVAMQNRTGDFRSEVLRSGVITDFQPHYRYGKTDILPFSMGAKGDANQISRRASSLKWAGTNDSGVPNVGPNTDLYDLLFGKLFSNPTVAYTFPGTPVLPSAYYPKSIQEKFPPGDFCNGPGIAGDGSLSPKTDEGGAIPNPPTTDDDSPYFRNVNQGIRLIAQPTFNSPNRQMPSAVYFGSIPAGAPWRTLLFRPARSYYGGGASHPGASSPPDYLMLDWFHMPIVEPYAISDPFATAGKINLNSRIMPFGDYIRRETALHAVLRSARIVAIPESIVGQTSYTENSKVSQSPATPTRYPVDVEKTLDRLRARFDGKNVDGSGQSDPTGKRVFLSNAEICSVDLVPEGASSLASFWSDKRTTGDNSLEAPYSSLLPRLTAKSNTFTVHVTAQALQTMEADGGWVDGKGVVGAEWRGSFGIERYIDSNDARLNGSSAPSFLSGTVSVEPYYKFRMFGERRFNP